MSAPTVSVPFRSLSDEQWAAVPRSIPAVWLSIGAWIPLLALVVYLFGFAPQRLELGEWQPYLISYSAFVGLIALLWGAGRHTAWIGLFASLGFYYLLTPTGIEEYVIFASAAYFAFLSMASLVGQLRFAGLLRSWHRDAQGTVQVPAVKLEQRKVTKILPSALWTMAGSALMLPAAKIIWKFFTDAGMNMSNIDRELFIEAGTGSIVLIVCLLLSAVKWLEARSVPLTVLEIPFAPVTGPLAYIGIGNSLPVQETERPSCSCAESKTNSGGGEMTYPEFLVCDPDCAAHGVRAVNSLEQRRFAEIGHEAWVYGDHARQELLPTGTRMSIVGLYGWDAAPVRVDDSVHFGRGAMATSNNILPRVAREPLRRAGRRMRWVDAKGKSLVATEVNLKKAVVIDQQMVPGSKPVIYSVRVEGTRPYLLDAPVEDAMMLGASSEAARRLGAG